VVGAEQSLGVSALLPLVKAPEALQAALSQIGVVETETAGDALWDSLKPGQSLVSKNGTYWRWDGYCIQAVAMDRHAQHMEQKNKLSALSAQKPTIEAAAASAQVALNEQLEAQQVLQATAKDKSAERREIEGEAKQKRAASSQQREEQARTTSNVQRLEGVLETAGGDIAELEALVKEDQAQLKAYEENAGEDDAQQLEDLKETLSAARSDMNDAARASDLIQQQQNTRQARLHAIADERINLNNRSIRARERLKQLEERQGALAEKLETLDHKPSDFEGKKDELLGAISRFEKARDVAAEALAVCEAAVGVTNRALKEAEGELGAAREARAHAQATLSGMQEQREGMEAAIREKFEMKAEDLPQHSAIDMDKEWGDIDSLRSKKEKMLRERDNIGPVNLRAEDEALELEKEVGTILHERNDLIQAIEELRGGIQKINKEARERLLVAFEHVNAHFSRLFVQLFGGGQAHLALIDSDDPLNSGLEIFAQPPGKALQSLSLLSGGEQTLASIALIFGMFLTNPSPICVLDEIDAPLDDANVDRVCDLLETIAERGETRFLVITHHRLTMARMDRLYGVTMGERGVSQLVSVDLQQSFDFVEAA
jgi:chromosome segregation protein